MGEIKKGTFRLYAGGNNTAKHEWTPIGGKAEEKHWEEVNQKLVAGEERWEGGKAPVTTQGVTSAAKSNVESWTLEALVLPAGATFLTTLAASLHVYNKCVKKEDFKCSWGLSLEGGITVKNVGTALQWDSVALSKAEAEKIAGTTLKEKRPLALTSELASKAEVFCCYAEVEVEWEEEEKTKTETFKATLPFKGSRESHITRMLEVTLKQTGILSKVFELKKVLSSTLQTIGSLPRNIFHKLSTILQSSGQLIRITSKSLKAELLSTQILQRRITHPPTALLQFTANVTLPIFKKAITETLKMQRVVQSRVSHILQGLLLTSNEFNELLDSFIRPNEDPLGSKEPYASEWTKPFWASNKGEVFNEIFGWVAFPPLSAAYWALSEYIEPEVSCVIFPENISGAWVAIWACLNVGSKSGYRLKIESENTESKFLLTLERCDNEVFTTVATKAGVILKENVPIDLTVRAGTFKAHYNGVLQCEGPMTQGGKPAYNSGRIGIEGETEDAFGIRNFKVATGGPTTYLGKNVFHQLQSLLKLSFSFFPFIKVEILRGTLMMAEILQRKTQRGITETLKFAGTLSRNILNRTFAATLKMISSGAINAQRALTSTLKTVGILQRFVTHAIFETLKFSGLLRKEFTLIKSLIETLKTTGQLPRNITRQIMGLLSFAGLIRKEFTFIKILEGTLQFKAILQRYIVHVSTGLLKFSISRGSNIVHTLTGLLPFSGVIARFGYTIPATLKMAGSIKRNITYALEDALKFATRLLSDAIQPLRATLQFAAHLGREFTLIKVIQSTLGMPGVLGKSISHALKSSLEFSGRLGRSSIRILQSTLSAIATLPRSIYHTLGERLKLEGEIVHRGSVVFKVTLQLTGSLGRYIGHRLISTLKTAGTILPTTLHALTSTLKIPGIIQRYVTHQFSSTLKFSISITPFVTRSIQATLKTIGVLQRYIDHQLNSTLKTTGTLISSTYHILSSTLKMTGSLQRYLTYQLISTLKFIASINRSISRSLLSTLKTVGFLQRYIIHQFKTLLTFSAVVVPHKIVEVIVERITATLTFATNLRRNINYRLNSTLSLLGSLNRGLIQIFQAALDLNGLLKQNVLFRLRSTFVLVGKLSLNIAQKITAVLTLTGKLFESAKYIQVLKATLPFATNLARSARLRLEGRLRFRVNIPFSRAIHFFFGPDKLIVKHVLSTLTKLAPGTYEESLLNTNATLIKSRNELILDERDLAKTSETRR